MNSGESLVILGKEILPGKKTVLNLDIARLHNRAKVEIPVIIERSNKKGPVLLLMASIHGDEINGVEIVRQILAKKFAKPEYGTVICIPTVNIFGFLNQSREFPDGKDLNRMFPGSKIGSLASIFASSLMTEILPFIDYCIDFHTGGAQRFNSPQIRIAQDSPEILELAHVFQPKFIVYAKSREKSFRDAATRLGKKVMLFEGGKSKDINRRITKNGVNGTLRVMHHLGMRDFSEELASTHPEASVVIEHSTWIRARHGGIFRFFIKDGVMVEKGEALGSISGPYGNFEHIVKSPSKGYLICVSHLPIVYQGDALFHLGLEI